MKWCTVEEDFLNYLRSCETRIPMTNYGPDKFKPFFGELFSIGDFLYLTQVAHPQARHEYIREDVDFYKFYKKNNNLSFVVNLNYMFPVLKSKIVEVTYKDIDTFRTFKDETEKNAYITLMKQEMKAIKARELDVAAQNLYLRKYKFPADRVSMRCVDFKDLENKCITYIQNQKK